MDKVLIACLGLAIVSTAQSTVDAYGQCGGSSYTGPTACGANYICTEYNPYYYQCIPGAASSTAKASTSSSPTSASASVTPTLQTTKTTSTVSTTPQPTTPTATSTGTDTPTTLLAGWYWIRAVESPYFHSYLQTLPTATPGDAVLDSPATAGQFNIVDGQLVYNRPTGAAAPPLYMWVEDAADKTQRALATWFNSTASTYGRFAFSGDTVTWTDPDVARPNTAAFYVCPGNGQNLLFVNTGAYLYDTPSGCYDIDIHYYGGSTAVV
ncbi:unnamed protein product [Discula destructiva]